VEDRRVKRDGTPDDPTAKRLKSDHRKMANQPNPVKPNTPPRSVVHEVDVCCGLELANTPLRCKEEGEEEAFKNGKGNR